MNAETLRLLGFVDVGQWVQDGSEIAYSIDGPQPELNELRLDAKNALYAFVRGENVQYVGKTARTIRKRFVGYRRPGKMQRTNIRCNFKIKEALAQGSEIRIYVFNPLSKLRYDDFEINLAAGLEDSLIDRLDPPWNGRDKGLPITEEAEREAEEEKTSAPEPTIPVVDHHATPLASFQILLGDTYYQQGLINVGVEASHFLGKDGEPIQVLFDDGTDPVVSGINRTANRSGGVRVVGQNRRIAQWFRHHFKKGDIVQGRVLDANRIILISPEGAKAAPAVDNVGV